MMLGCGSRSDARAGLNDFAEEGSGLSTSSAVDTGVEDAHPAVPPKGPLRPTWAKIFAWLHTKPLSAHWNMSRPERVNGTDRHAQTDERHMDLSAIPNLELEWPARIARVRRSQARTDPRGMTRPARDQDERAFLASRGQLGPFVDSRVVVSPRGLDLTE
jgi:hypothetical protein